MIGIAVLISLKGKLSLEDMKPLAQCQVATWNPRSRRSPSMLVISQFTHSLLGFCETGSYHVGQASFKLVIFLFLSRVLK